MSSECPTRRWLIITIDNFDELCQISERGKGHVVVEIEKLIEEFWRILLRCQRK